MAKRAPHRPRSAMRPSQVRLPQASLKVKLLALVISPVLFLLLAEIGLRLCGWGIPCRFWIPWSQQGQHVWVTNPRYCQHFVPKSLSREPAFSATLRSKPADVRRIVVLGGSAAYGDPDVAYGFCRQLEFLLNEHARDVRFEVINAAVTSMNSHVARRIARDAMRLKPDLMIAFMGNNEVVGPYGPPTLPTWLYDKGWFIDMSMTAKQRLRLAQFITHLARRTQKVNSSQQQWLGMEGFLDNQVTADSSKLPACYRHLRSNLQEILKMARAGDAQVLFCVPPVNLKDCVPFASRHREDLTEESLAQWQTHWQAGRQLEQAGDWQGAWDHYQEAANLDDRYADLRFCRGRCAAQLDRMEKALVEFQAALDLDTLRFRADSRQQEVIGEVASQAGLEVLDLQQGLQALCDDGILGREYLLDHVHLNFEGNFQAAWLTLGRIGSLLPGTLNEPDVSKEVWAMKAHERLLYGSQANYEVALAMYQRKTRPPFAGQLDHERELTNLRKELVELRQAVKRVGLKGESLAEAARRYPDDVDINRHYGQWLQKQGRGMEALNHYQAMARRCPFDMNVQKELALAHAFLGQYDQAVEVLTAKGAARRYSKPEALALVGSYYVTHGQLVPAYRVFTDLHDLAPRRIDALINLASCACHSNDVASIQRYAQQALKLDADAVQAMISMGNYYAKINDPKTACSWFERAVERDPSHYLAHISLGVQLLRCGQAQEGMRHMTTAMVLKPDFVEGYQLLAKLFQEAGQEERARHYQALYELFKT